MAGSIESESFSPLYEVDHRIDEWNQDPNASFNGLRVAIFGKGQLAETLFKRIHHPENNGHEVVAVVGPIKKDKDKDFDGARKLAQEFKIPNFKFEDLEKDPDIMAKLRDVNADVYVGASMTAFMPENIAGIPELGTWGWHPANVLKDGYRGPDSPQWQIYNGLNKIGMVLHAFGREDEQIVPKKPIAHKRLPLGSRENDPDDAADKGPILAVSYVNRDRTSRTTSDLFRNKLFPEGAVFIHETLDKMAMAKDQGLVFRGQPQVEGAGNYQKKMKLEDVRIDWNSKARHNKNVIEAASYALGAWTLDKDGNKIIMFDPKTIDYLKSVEPGLLSGIKLEKGNAVWIDCQDKPLQIGRMRYVPKDGPRGDITPAGFLANDLGWEDLVTKFT